MKLKLIYLISITYISPLLYGSAESLQHFPATSSYLQSMQSSSNSDSSSYTGWEPSSTTENTTAEIQTTPLYQAPRFYDESQYQSFSRRTNPLHAQFGPQPRFDIAPPISHVISAETWQTYQTLVNASQFVHQNQDAQRIYQDVGRQLDNIAYIAQRGSTYQISQLPAQLAQLSTAYDGLKPRVSEAMNTPNAQDERAIKYLQQELRCVTASLQQDLYNKHGSLIGKQIRNFGKQTIKNYKNQYVRGTPLRQFEAPSKEKQQVINRHGFNSILRKIDYYYERGNLVKANDEINRLLSTRSHVRKYGKIIKSFRDSHPSLNKLGIPKSCETNPNWPQYAQELHNNPQHRDAIIDQLSREQFEAHEICRQTGIRTANQSQLYQAHRLNIFKQDPYFLRVAGHALKNPNTFEQCMHELNNRHQAIQHIQSAMHTYPVIAEQLRACSLELICYANDPSFNAIIDTMKEHPSRVEAGRKLLAYRNNYVMRVRTQLGGEHFSPEAAQLAYTLSQTISNNHRLTLLNRLHNDSSHPGIRAAYETYYDQLSHLPRTHEYDQGLVAYALDLHMPASLGSEALSPERRQYANVMLQTITCPEQRAQAEQYLRTLHDAANIMEHRDISHQDALRTLTHIESQTYLNDQMQPTPEVRLQNMKLFNVINSYIQEGNLAQAANNINMLHNELKIMVPDVETPPGVQDFLNKHVTIEVQNNSPGVTERRPASSASPQTCAASSSSQPVIQSQDATSEYAQLRDRLQQHHAQIEAQYGTLPAYYQTRQHALDQLAQGNVTTYQQSYDLTPQAQRAIEQAGMNIHDMQQFEGNQLQHDTHAKLINAINQLTTIEPTSPQSQLLHEGALDCAHAGNACNQAGMMKQALFMTDMCQMTCDIAHGIFDGVCASSAAWWQYDQHAEPTMSASATPASSTYQLAVTSAGEFTDFVLGSAERIARGLKGIGHGIPEADVLQNLKDIGYLIGATAQRAGECAVHMANIHDALERQNFDGAQAHAEAFNETLGDSAGSIVQALDDLSDTIDYAIAHAPQTPDEWEAAGRIVGKYGTEAILTSKCIQSTSKVARGIVRALGNLDQTAKELKLAHGLSGQPVPKSHPIGTVRTDQVTREITSKFKTAVDAGDVLKDPKTVPTFQPSAQAASQAASSSSSGSSIVQRVTQTAQATKQFLATPQPGCIDFNNQQMSSSSAGISLENVLTADGRKIDVNKLDLDNLPLHLYDESICTGHQLQEFTSKFKNTPGAMGQDGPLQKLLEMGYKGAKPGNLAAARGALYELEVSNKLQNMGKQVIRFNENYKFGSAKREFDLIATDCLIECKNVDWSIKTGKVATDMRMKIGQQAQIARGLGKNFIVYSKQPLTSDWQNWFANKDITVKIGM